MEYRIQKHKRYDEYCVVQDEWFTIDELRKSWGKMRWKPVTHEDCGWGDCHNVTTRFNSLEKAEDLLDRIKHGDPRDEIVSVVVS